VYALGAFFIAAFCRFAAFMGFMGEARFMGFIAAGAAFMGCALFM
jgi:hypothetical protein